MAITLNGSTGIVEANIADNAITTNKIVSDAITSAKIASGTITSTDLASGAITYSLLPSGTIVQVKSIYSNASASMAGSQTFVNSGVYIDITPRFSTSTLIAHAQGHVYRNSAGHNWFRIINQTTGQISGNRGGRDQYAGYHEDVNIIWHQTAGNTNTQRFEIQFADRDNNSSVGLYFNDGGGYQSGMIVYEVVA